MRRFINMKKKTSQEKKENYAKRFLKEAEVPARFGKTTYIRKEYHQKIQTIVQTIGDGNTSLFSYLDNVIAEHLERHKEEIVELHNEYRNPLSNI